MLSTVGSNRLFIKAGAIPWQKKGINISTSATELMPHINFETLLKVIADI
ncbi:hypothetical protein TUM3792_37320 [Shewanella sp. MBTL60-007]|nr:hypothetical protein TUM3792_37320 [Shewanella sp. MBTL60-007]